MILDSGLLFWATLYISHDNFIHLSDRRSVRFTGQRFRVLNMLKHYLESIPTKI